MRIAEWFCWLCAAISVVLAIACAVDDGGVGPTVVFVLCVPVFVINAWVFRSIRATERIVGGL